jgi:hypothetical protein
MDAHEMDLMAAELDSLTAAVEEERFRHVAGLEPEPALARLFAAYSRAAHRETVKALREQGEEALAMGVASLRAERAQAEDEEAWRAADAKASARGPDGSAPLAALEAAGVREPDRERRLALARVAAEALAEVASLRERAVETRARARAEVGLAPDWRAVVEGDETLAASDDAYRDVLTFAARRTLGLAPHPAGELARADLLHLVEAPRYDGLFRPGMLALALKLTLEPLGLGLAGADRRRGAAAKWPGAHALARVSLRARGGAGDWHDPRRRRPRPRGRFRAAARARSRPGRGARVAPRDAPPRAALARRARRRRGKARARPRARPRAAAAPRAARRRRGAARRHRGGAGPLRGRLARGALRRAPRRDRGGVGGRARRPRRRRRKARRGARGAAAGEALRRALVERYDEDWWRNPRTGPHLAGLVAAGRLPEAEEPPAPSEAARRLAGKLEGK